MIDDQALDDIGMLLCLCRKEAMLSADRAAIEAIEARYRDDLHERMVRCRLAMGMVRTGATSWVYARPQVRRLEDVETVAG